MAFEYIVNGRVVKLPVNSKKVAVRFRESLPKPQRRSVIEEKPQVGSFDNRLEVPNETITIVDVAPSPGPSSMGVASAVEALNADTGVEQAFPVFDLGPRRQAVATDRVIVGFNPDVEAKVEEIVSDVGGSVVERKDGTDEYVIQIDPAQDPFDVANELTKRPEVSFAEPDFVTLGTHIPKRPTPPSPENGTGNGGPMSASATAPAAGTVGSTGVAVEVGAAAPAGDPLLGKQYAMRIIKADKAWAVVQPSPAIKIAILDEGVDTFHPDLSIVGTYDAMDKDADQQPNPWDGHGTSCAGLAAATGNNGLGIRGVAGGCSLLAVRIAASPAKGEEWVTSNSQISDAIDWAWRNGADILSNSWGGGAPSTAITNAFKRARTLGRGGLGCVILVAAGNESGPIQFPADNPNVLTVTASNEFDEPKTRTSADGETWWGSCFGSQADIAAPGVHNYTTDISGPGGYNDGSGSLDADYYDIFNGTSSATPIAAGVAALVLSANPNLKEAAVRKIMTDSADKVGTVIYTSGRNNRMGYGRVNALAAVNLAKNWIP